eukprot:scaffold80299_cov14-Prasinocladus_malaysianus.AAC.1
MGHTLPVARSCLFLVRPIGRAQNPLAQNHAVRARLKRSTLLAGDLASACRLVEVASLVTGQKVRQAATLLLLIEHLFIACSMLAWVGEPRPVADNGTRFFLLDCISVMPAFATMHLTFCT